MSSHQPNRNQPIPFNTLPMDEQVNSRPASINNFPSNSQFNYPQLQSAASINYNDEQNPQIPSQNQIIQDQQEEELQKISLQKNQIDQDEILRMFREEQNRMERNKRANDKKKPNQSRDSQHHKDKKSSNQPSTKKQQNLGQDLQKRRQPTQQSLPFIAKTTSFKQLKSQPQSTSPYFTILSSQAVRQLLLQYKIQYRSSVYDPDWQKQRYRLKEGFFEQLCIGVEEMRQKPESELSQQQSELLYKLKQLSAQVIRMPYDFGTFKYCRNLVIEIDIQLFMHFHQKSKQPLSKDYKSQYKILLTNLKDPQNYELRQKILTRKMDAEMLKIANQFELLTESKRNQIKEKQQKLLKEFSIDHQRTMLLKPQFENEKQEQRVIESISYGPQVITQQPSSVNDNQPQLKTNESLESLERDQPSDNLSFSLSSLLAVNKYVEESTLSQLEQLLSEGQMQRMRTRLDEDLKGECRTRMLRRFDSLVLSRV